MLDYQKRVVEEKDNLDEKIAKLEVFIEGEIYSALDFEMQSRFKTQLEFMSGYSEILGERIDNF